MAPILYMEHSSPPSRAVLMAAKCMNIELEVKICDVVAGEQFKEDYLKVCIVYSTHITKLIWTEEKIQ